MTIAAVFDALNAAIVTSPGGVRSIDLWTAATVPPSNNPLAPLAGVLSLFRITAPYTLNTPVLNESNINVTLSAVGTFGQPEGTAYNITASLVYTDNPRNPDFFVLSLTVTDPGWTFSGFFTVLPGSLIADPQVSYITPSPSFLNGMQLLRPVFSGSSLPAATLTLTGLLPEPADPAITRNLDVIAPWPLSLSGTIVMPASASDPPVLNIRAVPASGIRIVAANNSGVPGPATLGITDVGLAILIPAPADMLPGEPLLSTLELFGTLHLGSIAAYVYTPILSIGKVWSLHAQFDKRTASLVQGLKQLTALFGVELPIPDNLPVLSSFAFDQIDLDLRREAPGESFSLSGLAISIGSRQPWTPPVPFLTIRNVGARWVWSWTPALGGETVTLLTGSVYGSFTFGDTSKPPSPGSGVRINASLSLPDFLINASMADGDYVSIGNAFKYYFGGTGPFLPAQMNLTQLNLAADPLQQTYAASAAILFGDPANPDPNQGWNINLLVITVTLQQLNFYVSVAGGTVTGGISGTLLLDDGTGPNNPSRPQLLLSADYPAQDPLAPSGWTLSGVLAPGTAVNLTTLVYQFIYGKSAQPPEWVPSLSVDRLSALLTTGSGTGPTAVKPSYIFAGTISAGWQPTLFGTTLKINAAVSVDMTKPSTADTASGRLSCAFSVNKLSLLASLSFGVPEPTYLFRIQFDQAWLEAVTAWRTGPNDDRHQVVAIQLGGVTIGDILEYLVDLAAPTLGFRLDPPWDVLKQIDLSRFILTVDPKYNVVEFVFNANVDLVVMRLDSIGVRYARQNGENTVDLILTGNFLGKAYDSNQPLAWDVINDPPPAVPGQGTSLIDLRYLGVGQRLTFNVPDAQLPQTVAASVDLLRQSMQKPKDPHKSPLSGQGMKFSAGSEWLIGLDLQLMQTVDVGFIFNDPRLYGLSIGLAGEKAGSLAGLRFEILYKKITADTGMFRVELRVPDAFRTLQLGVVSVTLSIIVLEIYTNGNFKVDLGFPFNRNFERSFALQAAIFIGRGGFYFGLLDGDTSSQVPRISNGNFAPVLELGIGIAAGVGREIRAGILQGGIYVELEVLFQGVLGWFNPNSSGAAPAKYFWCHGIVALHGKLYGSVDFSIIKVSVTLEAFAQASVIFQCYQPTIIELSVAVEAEAEVQFLFFSISFSFGVNLDVSFTLGAQEPTPWTAIAGGAGGPRLTSSHTKALHSNRLKALRNEHLMRIRSLVRAGRDRMGTSAAAAPPYILAWTPTRKVFPDSPRNAHMTLLPLFTVGDVPVDWSSMIPPNTNPRFRAAFVLCADTGMDSMARTASQVASRSAALSAMAANTSDTSTLAADILVQGLLLYALNSIQPQASAGGALTAGQLALLLEQMADPQTLATGFSLANLSVFFQTNIAVWLSGDLPVRPAIKGAMTFPIPPFLSWVSPQTGPVSFQTCNPIGPLYEWQIAATLGHYRPVGAAPQPQPTDDDPADYESFASFVFRDFCLMIARSAVEEARRSMAVATVVVGSNAGVVWSLAQTAATLPQATVTYEVCGGNTLESVAINLGATVAELEFLNPGLAAAIVDNPVGTALQVILGVAPEVLALDNPDAPFVAGQWSLGTVFHQAGVIAGPPAVNETLSSIASLFEVNDAATLLSFDSGTRVRLSSDPNVPRAGATLDLAARNFAVAPADFVQTRVAAAFYARYRNPDLQDTADSPNLAAWYAQAIASLNPNSLQNIFLSSLTLVTAELQPGQPLQVPDTYNNRGSLNTYTTVTGDTLLRIGTTLALQQDFGSTTVPVHAPDWPAFLGAVTTAGSNAWSIPACSAIVLQPGDTLEDLARRLICDASWNATGNEWTYDWVAVAQWAGTADILAPLAVIPVPGAQTTNGTHTFSEVSRLYGVTIPDFAAAVADVNGLFAQDTVLAVRQLPAQQASVLADAVVSGTSFAAIVNQASRMLLAGLQLPALMQDTTGHTVPNPALSLPLYDLTGQQFDVAVDATQPSLGAVSVSVSNTASWISLMNSITVPAGTTLAQMQQLEAQYPGILIYNPGVPDFVYPLANSIVLLTGSIPGGTTLDYVYTNQQVIDNSPQTGLAVTPSSLPAENPQPMPLSGSVARTYGFEHRIELQTPIQLPIPLPAGGPPVSGLPSLWPFPETLARRAQQQARAPEKTAYEILATSHTGAAARHANALLNTTFASLLRFRVRRAASGESTFDLLGVDGEQRHLLLSLWTQLGLEPAPLPPPAPPPPTPAAWVLTSPAPNASNTSGLTLLNAPAAGTYLLKSNFSTESVPQPPPQGTVAQPDVPPPLYFASLASTSLRDFLLLLWEGSVVGGTGYYFGTSSALPPGCFDEHGIATLSLLVSLASQQQAAPTGRTLLPSDNCLLTGPGLDLAVHALFAESYDDSDIVVQALVPPGNVGFTVVTDRPVNVTDPSQESEVLLRNLYSLLTFELSQQGSNPALPPSPFLAPASGMPVLPAPWDGTEELPMLREKRLRRLRQAGGRGAGDLPAKPYRRYQQVLPLYNFAAAAAGAAAADVIGLPPAAQDPYRGLGLQSALPGVYFQFGFGDLLGNRTAPAPGASGKLDMTTGYTDNLIGVGEWPAISLSFDVGVPPGTDLSATLELRLSARPSALLPSPSQSGSVSEALACNQAQKYSQSYYQLVQGQIGAALVTSLKVVANGSGANTGIAIADLSPLIRFAGGAYAHACSVTALTAAAPLGATKLSEVVAQFGVPYAQIAAANADSSVQKIFGATPLTVPAYFPFVEHDSLEEFCIRPPQGWPQQSALGLLTLPENQQLPLVPGIALTLVPAVSIPTGSTAPTADLATFAKNNNTTVALLAADNASFPVLTDGFIFSIETDSGSAASVAVNSQTGPGTLQAVTAAFAAQGINLTVTDLAQLYAATAGMFAINQTLASNHYVAKADDTLETNGSGVPVTTLIANNTATRDLFDPGALVYFGNFTGVTYNGTPTLRQLADRYSCPMELLLAANASASLIAATTLVVPGMLAWPADTTTLRIPYSIQTGDTLTNIAARFASPGGTGGGTDYLLAQANLNMPGTLLPNINITVNGTPVTTGANASFSSVIAAVSGATLTDLVSAISTDTGVLQTGALLLCAPALLPNACTPTDIATLYGLDAAAFGLANAASPGLIAGSQTLYCPDGSVSIATQAGDTFNSLIARFGASGIQTDAGGIAGADKNAGVPFLQAGALALLSPSPVILSTVVGDSGPYPGPVFALEVTLRLTRPAALIATDFKTADGSGPVERADSVIPAPAKDSDTASGGLTFDAFISAMAAAMPELRIATGKVPGNSSDLWCVNFDSAGIASAGLTGPTTIIIGGSPTQQPRCFSLKPLYNHLVTRSDVFIQPLNSAGGLDAAVPVNYPGTDVEPWARRLLGDIDRFLSAPYATRLYGNSGAQQSSLTRVLGCKNELVQLIAAGLDSVLDTTDPGKAAGLVSARASLQQQLGASLAAGYEAAVILQYSSCVSSAWQSTSAPAPARLYGEPDISGMTSTVRITAGKIDLTGASGSTNFLLTVSDLEHRGQIQGALNYTITNIEINIDAGSTPKPYVASDWLSFVPPLTAANEPAAVAGTNPGPLDAPLPLRVFPAMPVMKGQTAAASFPDDTATLAQYPLWTYGLTYSHEHAEQDYVRITAEFNLAPAVNALFVPSPRDLFTELAQYMAVADQLWLLLDGLVNPASSVPPEVVAAATGTFTDLVSRVTDYWSSRLDSEQVARSMANQPIAAPTDTYPFNARVGYRDGARGREMSTYTLTLLAPQTSPGPVSIWPVVSCIRADGTRIALRAGTPTATTLVYTVDPDTSIPATAWPVFSLEWGGLNVSAVQNARSRLSVLRNQNLIADSPVATNPAFLLRTAEVTATNLATPLLNRSRPQPITAADPGSALLQALSTLFPAAGQLLGLTATFGIYYGYELTPNPADPAASLTSTLPVALYPNQALAGGVTGPIQAAINTWSTRENPMSTGGEWAFSLVLYSVEESTQRPLLSIDRLYFRIG